MLRKLGPSALLLVLFGSCSSSGAGRAARMRTVDTSAMITLDNAVAIAQAQVPNGFAIEAVLEVEDDDEQEPPAYEVVFWVPATQQVIEVEVHAMTGAVLEVEVEEDGDGED